MKLLKLYLYLTFIFLPATTLLSQQLKNTLSNLQYLRKIKPKSSKAISQSYWGIQSGTLDKSKLKYAGKIGVKWFAINMKTL